MTSNSDARPSGTPPWPHCGHNTAADGVGCAGRRVGPHTACLAHLPSPDRSAYLAGLQPGADVDHRGTAFTDELLSELLTALTDSASGRPRFGRANFEQARFSGDAVFEGAGFDGDAWFMGAEISGQADFGGVKFNGDVSFLRSKFNGGAWFGGVEFHGTVWFRGAEFHGNAVFLQAVFEHAARMGPLACTGTLDLSEAVFATAVTIEAAAAAVHCRRTRWASTAALRLRHAAVDLSDAVLEYPVSVAARSRPFTVDDAEMAEPDLTGPRVRVVSLRGVDAAHLVLTDLDLTDCRFAGTIHLDQLRLEGRYTLAVAPSGLRRRGIWPVRWTPRRTLAEEHHWRASRSAGADGWAPPLDGDEVLEPAALAPVYRQLRKSFEDGKHEPGAADFYYGEMEMRRHADDIPRAERSLLTAYWALSGYGLRASRALAWLLTSMTATVLAMMLWGLPQDDAQPRSSGTVTGRSITLTTDAPAPINPSGPYWKRVSTERFEKSLRVVINSVVFRSSDQSLTTAGTYTEMASRLAEPVLLTLAVLAIRGRVKR
ncbi:pentapeptide repeat-containing protein [Streptomyces ferrugineus]|uniref:pentapeptide repeat-containing protein n=1 Tax=Streptomyces ferrugineus TaxID=1413221 RepID=UPI001D1410D4|nr:pentapeptide repeat-containing protein [Streptomyces ferrugineus]